MKTSILLTGKPGSGKTTAIRKALAQLTCSAGGFFTEEIRESGRRVGFRIVTLDGQSEVLAHLRGSSKLRVGRYKVNLPAIEELGVASIAAAIHQKELVVIDEIGPMELYSSDFRQIVMDALDSDVPVLGTIARRKTPYTETIRARPEVKILEIRVDNRNAIVNEILQNITASLSSK